MPVEALENDSHYYYARIRAAKRLVEMKGSQASIEVLFEAIRPEMHSFPDLVALYSYAMFEMLKRLNTDGR